MRLRRSEWFCFLLGLTVSAALASDVPWINDEPLLFDRALEARATGRWWMLSLAGTAGAIYGPVGFWFYRVALFFTQNPVAIVIAKAFFFQTVSFLFLRRTLVQLRLPTMPAFLIFLSPYLFHYSRILWDNCFLLPVFTLGWWGWVSFTVRPRWTALAAWALSAWLAIHIHLMALAFVFPTALTLVYAQPDWFRLRRFQLFLCVLTGALSLWPYFSEMWASHSDSGRVPFSRIDVIFLSILYGPRLLFPFGFFDYFLPKSDFSGVPTILAAFCAPLYGLVFWGLKKFYDENRPLFLSIVGTLAVLALLHGVLSLQMHPHYAIPVTAGCLFAFARGYEAARLRRAWRGLIVIGFFAQGISVLAFLGVVHHFEGDRSERFGATLGNQIAVAKVVGQAGRVKFEGISNYEKYPQALSVLRKLVAPTGTPATWKVSFTNADERFGTIAVTEVSQ